MIASFLNSDLKPVLNADKGKLRFAVFILLGLAIYQFALCFLNTNIFTVSNALVAAAEITLLLLMLVKVWPTLCLNEIAYFLLFLLYFIALWISRGAVDFAAPRDIAIIFLSFAFGRTISSRAQVNRIIWIISAVVILVAAIEYFFTKTYLQYFNILHYYIARGEVAEFVPSWVKQNTFISGVRTGGRNLFPFLGNLRVSSIFLEPVSLGNYAILVALWALSFDGKQKTEAIKHLIVALILIVACDSRFASLLVSFLFVIRISPLMQKRGVLFVLPALAISMLAIIFIYHLGDPSQDNLTGRLARTGEAICHMSLMQVSGLGSPEPLLDMGIAYAIEHFGIIACLILWLMFVVPQRDNRYAARFRALLAIYALAILAISGTSFFSAKTGALLWFIYGSMCTEIRKNENTVVLENSISSFKSFGSLN